MKSGVEEAKSLSPAVTRAAAILDVLATDGGRPMGPSELARQLGIAKSSVANICHVLADAGLLHRTEEGYRLGRKLARLGAAYLSGVDVVREFYEIADRSGNALQQTLQLAMLGEGLDVVYLARRDGTAPVRLVSEVGRHLPATCTATGKAMLAELSPEELQARLDVAGPLAKLTPHSITEVEQLHSELTKVRDRGYAVDDQETTEGVLCLGMAVRRRDATNRTALSFTLLKVSASIDRVEQLLDQLRAFAEELGGSPGA